MNNNIKSWTNSLEAKIESLQDKNLYRQLKENKCIDFSSNDYLSFNSNGTINKILKEIVNKSTIKGSTGSRLIRGHHHDFMTVETEFANFVEAESSLLFHSGYAANTGTIPAIIDARRDIVFCDRLSHASILDGIRLSQAKRIYFKHNNLTDLSEKLSRFNCTGRKWILTESVFSMDGDIVNLPELMDIANKYDCLVYLDEAHSIGIFGKSGNGLACAKNVQDQIAIRVFPCGKAPGFMGAFVAGSIQLKKILINKARSFIYSTSQPPFMARALSKIINTLGSNYLVEARKNLDSNIKYLRNSLQESGFNTLNSSTQIIPVVFNNETECLHFQSYAEKMGYDIRAIRPPTVPENSCRIRLCLQSGHTRKQIDGLIKIFSDYSKKSKIQDNEIFR